MQSLHRVEKSPPSDGTGGITAGDLSTQSIIRSIPVCLPYRHVPPLEMTMLASATPVISTKAQRSGEISPSDSTGGITVGDLSAQSIIGAFSICPIPTRSPARDDHGGGP